MPAILIGLLESLAPTILQAILNGLKKQVSSKPQLQEKVDRHQAALDCLNKSPLPQSFHE